LFNFICHDSESGEHLKYDFYDNIRHLGRRCHRRIKLEPSKDIVDANKDKNELVLARTDVLGYLTDASVTVTMACLYQKMEKYPHQEKKSNTSENWTGGGECLRDNDVSPDLRGIAICDSPK
jgi:hypothetical protein